MTTIQSEEVYNSICISVASPEGEVYVIISDDAGKVIRVEIHIGKSGSTLRAWATSLAEIITNGLEHNIPLSTFQNLLIGQVSDKSRTIKPGFEIKSGAEAVGYALLRYAQIKATNARIPTDTGYFKYR